MNFKFSGINIFSSEPVKVFDFYKKLGFKVVEECEPDNPYYGAMFSLVDNQNEPTIWIWRCKKEEESTAINHFVFGTNNKLEETYEHFKGTGIDCNPPVIADWGGNEMMLTDPVGNKLLFLD